MNLFESLGTELADSLRLVLSEFFPAGTGSRPGSGNRSVRNDSKDSSGSYGSHGGLPAGVVHAVEPTGVADDEAVTQPNTNKKTSTTALDSPSPI